ncbi:MAG: biopolymer transporter ExbD [Bdellovibrionota bacterium]
MAHISTGGGGRRSVNEELNLVPFIDLMSVLITFLLITAVWTQINMIQMGSSFYGKRSDDTPQTPPPNADYVLKVEVKTTGYVLTAGKQVIALPKIADAYDDGGLGAQLQRIKQIYPEKTDSTLAVADDIPYEAMIKAMDTILIAGFSNINFATGAPP